MKVLVAVDGSQASTKAVGFARALVAGNPDVSVTLFHVVDTLPEFIATRTATDVYGTVARDWADSHRSEGQRILAAHRDDLTRAGVPATAIRTALLERESRPEARRTSAAIAIIEEMRNGGHDVVVLGRRSTSATNESLIGSVAERIARESAGRTICIVD